LGDEKVTDSRREVHHPSGLSDPRHCPHCLCGLPWVKWDGITSSTGWRGVLGVLTPEAVRIVRESDIPETDGRPGF
jgi:hypothetical protein